MYGADTFTESSFTMRRLDDFVPKSYPLRSIRTMANQALTKMDRLVAGMYEADVKGGFPSIAPEKLLRAMHVACSPGDACHERTVRSDEVDPVAGPP